MDASCGELRASCVDLRASCGKVRVACNISCGNNSLPVAGFGGCAERSRQTMSHFALNEYPQCRAADVKHWRATVAWNTRADLLRVLVFQSGGAQLPHKQDWIQNQTRRESRQFLSDHENTSAFHFSLSCMLRNTHQLHGTDRKELSFPRKRQLSVAFRGAEACETRRPENGTKNQI